MNFKCSITRQKCPIGDFEYDHDLCPNYKDSSYRYKPGEGKSGASFRLDSLCRFYGIERADKNKDRDWLDK